MSDIVERLRDSDSVVLCGLFHAIPAMHEAANEIERLRAQVARAQSLPDAWEQKAKRSEHVVYDADMLNECAVELRESLTSTDRSPA